MRFRDEASLSVFYLPSNKRKSQFVDNDVDDLSLLLLIHPPFGFNLT